MLACCFLILFCAKIKRNGFLKGLIRLHLLSRCDSFIGFGNRCCFVPSLFFYFGDKRIQFFCEVLSKLAFNSSSRGSNINLDLFFFLVYNR